MDAIEHHGDAQKVGDVGDGPLHLFIARENDAEVIPCCEYDDHADEADGEGLEEDHDDSILGGPGATCSQLVGHPNTVLRRDSISGGKRRNLSDELIVSGFYLIAALSPINTMPSQPLMFMLQCEEHLSSTVLDRRQHGMIAA